MQHRYIKTPSGRHEALAHHRELPRSLRNLLLVINDSQPVDYWLSNVKGVAQTDVDRLLAEGLIAEAQACLHPEQWPASPTAAEAETQQLWAQTVDAIEQASATLLSQTLKALAWPLLRGTRAYQFVQEVEACETPEDLRQIARAFAGLVRGELGSGVVRQLRATLTGEQALPSKTSVFPLPSLNREPPTKPAAPAAEDGVDVVQAFRLRRWPAAQTLSQPGFARLASLLSTRTLTLQQLVILGRVEAAVCWQFLQEMRQLGLLETRDPSDTGASTSVAMMTATRPPIRAGGSTPRAMSGSAPPVSFGLLGRLRERLGLR
jgi:hypothetical protein